MTRYVKNPPGTVTGPVCTALGGVFTGIFGLASIVMFAVQSAVPSAGLAMAGHITLSVTIPLTIVSAVVMAKGISLVGRVRRFRRYTKLIGERTYCQVKELASAVGKNEKFVVRDIQKLIENRAFTNGHLDAQNTCLMLDECFHDFLEEGSVHTLLPRVKENPKLFVLRAFTKMYGMAGLRLGYAICSDTELIRRMEQVTQPWNVSVPAQAAGIAAAREQEFVAVSRQMITEQKKLLLAGLEAAGAKVYGSAANYIFFRAAPGFDTRMYRAGFMVRNCGNYDGLTEGFYRIAVRGEADNRAFLQALQELEQREG